MNASPKPVVGVYRTSFPLYSETFIGEQVRALSAYAPLIVTRTPHAGAEEYELIGVSPRARSTASLLFTAFGVLGHLADNPRLNKVRLLHAHFAPDAVMAMPISRRLGVPLVATFHGSDVTVSDWNIVRSGKISGWRYLLQRQALIEYASRFLAVSDFLRARMIAAGYPADKVVRHYVGVDTRRFVPRSTAEPILDGMPYVLSVARHSEVKGLDVLIEAFARVAARHPGMRLIQIGSGGLTPRLKALVTEHGLDGRVVFLGAQPPREVLRHVQNCQLLVLSSRRARDGGEESFGLVLTEAAACGIPTVATRVGGIPEAVAENETGLLVPPDDPEALADAIDALVGNPDLAEAMGKRARELACDCFDLHRQTRLLERIYAEVA